MNRTGVELSDIKKSTMAKDIKWPRVEVSKTRHSKLAAEAKRRGLHIKEVAEEKFKKAA